MIVSSRKREHRKNFHGICKDEEEPVSGQGRPTPGANIPETPEATADQNEYGKTSCNRQHRKVPTIWDSARTERRRTRRCCRWTTTIACRPNNQHSHGELQRFSSWLKMQGVHQEPSLVDMTQERTTRRIRQLEEELFAEMQASRELDKHGKTPEQKGATSTTVLEEEVTIVRKLSEQQRSFTTSLH